MIDRRVKLFLTVLKDGRWHDGFVKKVITAKVVMACVYLGIVKQRLTKIDATGWPHFRASFRITWEGRQALKEGDHPTREKIKFTMKHDV